MCSSSHPPNAVGVVPVVVQLAVCEELACEDQIGKFVAAGRRFGVVAFCAVEVAVEDAGVAIAAEKDQGVGKGLEEAFDGSFDSLAGLGVVVYYYCLVECQRAVLLLMGKRKCSMLTTAFTGISWTKVSSNTFLKSAASPFEMFEKLFSSGLSYSENFLSI